MRYKSIPFNQGKYPFVKHLERLFYGENIPRKKLENIHTLLKEQYVELFEVGKDSSTVLHDRFYDKYKGGWPEMEYLYEYFISGVVAPLFNEDFLYQRFPTVRFQILDNVAVGAFHTDSEFNHPEGEINYIIPLTDSDGTASV